MEDQNKNGETANTNPMSDTNTNTTESTSTQMAEPVMDTAPVVAESTMAEPGIPTPEGDTMAAPAMAMAMPHINVKLYVGVVVGILLISALLVFALEKQNRIDTGIFTSLIERIEANNAVATVNGATIINREYQNGVKQLTDYVVSQGGDINDPEVVNEINTQAIDTLINAEVLRQAALEAGFSVTADEVATRYTEIETSIGGAEVLKTRMVELGVSEAELRDDIENELLIQQLFDSKITVEVTEEELAPVFAQYEDQETGYDKDQLKAIIKEQLAEQKKVGLINEYVEELRAAAAIEVFLK